MIQNILASIHTKFGRYLVSVILGIGLSSIFRKTCIDKECLTFKGPHHDDIVKNTYSHNNDCYTFKSSSISCNSKQRQIHYA
jgi:hypothetical protein